MAAEKVKQYLLTVKWGTKIIKGLETTGLSIKPNFEPVLLKEDEGKESQDFVDFDTEMSISGKTYQMDKSADAATTEDFETLRVASSVGSQVAFIYGRTTTGNQQVAGYGWITDWKEDAGSENKMGSWSGSIKARKGHVTFPNQA